MPKTTSPRRTRLPAAERRAQILAVARELFVMEGIERTSMRRIAEAAGITPTAIYDHFSDKGALLAAIAEEFFDGLIAAMERARPDPADPLARLRGIMRNYVEYGLTHPHEYRLVFMTVLPGFSPAGGHRGGRGRTDGAPMPKGVASFGMLEAEIGALIAAGHLRDGGKEAFADSVWAMGHGIVSLAITVGHCDFTPMADWLPASISVLIHGMAPRSPTGPEAS